MQKRLDGGYGWAIVFAHFIVSACVFGVAKTNGVMFVYFQNEFNAPYAAISAISFSQRLSESLTALLFSFLAERFGSRPVMLVGGVFLVVGTVTSAFAKSVVELVLTFGILVGLGSSMLLYPGGQMIPKYFDKKVAIASAFAFTGGSFGPFVLPFIIEFAINNFGLSGSFWILAGVLMHVFIGAVIMRPGSFFAEKSDQPEKEEPPSLKKMWEIYKSCFLSKSLMLFYFAYFAACLSVYNYLAFQQAFAKDLGIYEPTLLNLLTSIWGLCEITARISFAFVVQSGVLPSYRIFQLCSIIFAAVFFTLPTITSYWAIAVCSGLVAFVWSITVVCLMPTVRFAVGIELCSAGFGLVCLPSLFAFVTIQISGFVRDYTGTFVWVFYACAVMLIFGTFSLEIIAYQAKTSIFNKISSR